jgi:Lon protease-like protein
MRALDPLDLRVRSVPKAPSEPKAWRAKTGKTGKTGRMGRTAPRAPPALLEAPDIRTRAEILIAATEMELARDANAPSSLQ